jgi:hypothetical protein
VDDHSPKKASLYAAIIPGAGQFYNKKYWKIPLVYLSLGSALYVAKQNQNEYLHYRQAFEYRTDEDETTIDPYVDQYTESNLITEKNIRRKNRDLAYIIAAGIYLLNIIDASVDAHLFKFNVNDDISLNIQPQFMQENHQNTLALSLKLNWN